MLDPSLPPLGVDPRYPTTDLIVIPRGRLLAVRPDLADFGDRTVLTIADGVSNRPVGYAPTNLLRENPQMIQYLPLAARQELIEVPYVASVNDLYGQLRAGDRITAYFGSVTSTTPNPMDRGRIVKWVPRSIHTQTGSAGATHVLSAANLPAFQPRVLLAYDGSGALITGLSTAYNWNGTAWEVTFSGAGAANVATVVFEFGQGPDQIAGEVVRIQKVDQEHLMQGWLEWVTDNYAQWDYAPLAVRVPVSDVTNETPTLVSPNVYRLLNRPVAFWKPIKVEIQGSYINESGQVVSSGAGWLEMPLGTEWVQNWTIGKYHSIDPWTGILSFAANVSVTAVRVSYSYETSYRDGRLWASGMQGLTDGSGPSGIVGLPPHLDVPGFVGALRVIIY